MIRRALILGGLAALVLAPAAPAQTQEGEGTTTQTGSGGTNVQSGTGKVDTPPPARTPAATRAPVRSAPAPRVTATPRMAAGPVVVAPKPAPSATVRTKAASPKVRCPSRIERQVLQRRAAGQSVRRIASALDVSRARVRSLQRRAVGLLLADSDPARCDKAGGSKKKASRTAASTGAAAGAKTVVAPTPTAASPAAGTSLAPAGSQPANIALTPQDSKSRLFLYIGIGILALFVGLAILQTRGGFPFKRGAYYR